MYVMLDKPEPYRSSIVRFRRGMRAIWLRALIRSAPALRACIEARE